MPLTFDTFVEEIQMSKQPSVILNKYKLNDMFDSLPAQIFENWWRPIVEKEGFYSGIKKAVRKLEQRVFETAFSKEKDQAADVVKEKIIVRMAPIMATSKSNDISTQELLKRIKLCYQTFKWDFSICANLVAYFQRYFQTREQGQSRQLVNKILELFGTTQKVLDWVNYGWQTMSQEVFQSMFLLARLKLDEAIDRLLSRSNSLSYLMGKFRGNPQNLASTISSIVDIKNNRTARQAQANLCRFFLLAQAWQKSRLSELYNSENIRQVFAQAMNRLLYLIHGREPKVARLFFKLLNRTSLAFDQKMQQAIGYHLVALYQIQSEKNKELCEQIRLLWWNKLQASKLQVNYLMSCPQSIRALAGLKSNAIQKTQYVPGTDPQRIEFTGLISPKKRLKQFQISIKNEKILIEVQLRKMKLQKVYLLLKHFVEKIQLQSKEYQNNPDSFLIHSYICVLVALLLRLKVNFKSRITCSSLIDAVLFETSKLIPYCHWQKFGDDKELQIMDMFKLCLNPNLQLDLENLISFYKNNCYQESLTTLYRLNQLHQVFTNYENNPQNHKYSQTQQFKDSLTSFSMEFFRKVRLFLKGEIFDGPYREKQNFYLQKLITIGSPNILFNLLANQIFKMLKQQRHKLKDSQQVINLREKRFNDFSDLLNSQVDTAIELDKHGNTQGFSKVIIILSFNRIFQQFELSSPSNPSNVFDQKKEKEEKNKIDILQFLLRKANIQHFSKYSQIYYRQNYLKESLFFLEKYRYNRSFEKITKAEQLRAYTLYSRLNVNLNKELQSINKDLKNNIEQETSASLKNHESQIKLVNLSKFLDKKKTELIELQINKQNSTARNSLLQWLIYYRQIVLCFSSMASDLRQSLQIKDTFLKLDILMKITNLHLTFASPSEDKLKNILVLVNCLQKDEQKLQLLKNLLKTLKTFSQYNVAPVQQQYFSLMLKIKSHQELKLQLFKQPKVESEDDLSSSRKRFLFKSFYKQEMYERVLKIAQSIKNNKENISWTGELRQLQLQCRFRRQVIYSLDEAMKFIFYQCLNQKHKDFSNQDYFKIFRMLFDRYTFVSDKQNQDFLKIYFKFYQQVIPEHKNRYIFYLLRFIFQKFTFAIQKSSFQNYIDRIFKTFAKEKKLFLPFCQYVYKRRSENSQKNSLVQTFLIEIVSEYEEQNIWFLNYLSNHIFGQKKDKDNKLAEEIKQAKLNQIYAQKLYEKIQQRINPNQQKKKMLDQKLKWIATLIAQARNASTGLPQVVNMTRIPVPDRIVSIFSPDHFIKCINKIQPIGEGKSKPVIFELRLINKNDPENRSKDMTIKVIVKMSILGLNANLERNTANFVNDLDLLDPRITYKIKLLNRYFLAVQYLEHQGTVYKIIQKNFQYFHTKQSNLFKKACQRYKQRKESNNQHNKFNVLQQFKDYRNEIKVPFSKYFYEKSASIGAWWTKYSLYMKTLAQWSFLGYSIGLGDRHLDNILLTRQGMITHIDLEYVFDIGIGLPVPQLVPFRLTDALVQPLGILGPFGTFQGQMLAFAKTLEQQQEKLWWASSNFVAREDVDIPLEIVKRSKFQNMKNVKLQQGISYLIETAVSPEILSVMFPGWKPWI